MSLDMFQNIFMSLEIECSAQNLTSANIMATKTKNTRKKTKFNLLVDWIKIQLRKCPVMLRQTTQSCNINISIILIAEVSVN